MRKPLLAEKVAVLVANGFNEQDMTAAQRALVAAGANVRIIAMDNGLVNSWNGESWGLHFAADGMLNAALAADFSMLVIPGGHRSMEKLKLTAHTRRFISGFLDADKPLALFGDAIDLLIHTNKISGRHVTAPENLKTAAKNAGAKVAETPSTIDQNLMTGNGEAAARDAFAKEMVAHFIASMGMVTQAA